MKLNKFFGVMVVLAVICLSIGNAVTGHGIKGNENLNVAVLADESSGTESDTGWIPVTYSWPIWTKHIGLDRLVYEGPWYDAGPPAGKVCRKFTYEKDVTCELGGSTSCMPGTLTYYVEECFTPKQ